MSDDTEWRELRIRIGADHHQKLIALKVLRRKTMTDTIHEALDHYFAEVFTQEEAADDADPTLSDA